MDPIQDGETERRLSFSSSSSGSTHAMLNEPISHNNVPDQPEGSNSLSEPWREVIPNVKFPSFDELSIKANSGPRSDIRLLKELDAKSR